MKRSGIVVMVGVAAAALFCAGAAAAQAPDAPLAVYKVRHDHAIGSGAGELRITATGVEFRGEGGESKDDRTWADSDIKRIEFREREIAVYVYEAGRVPILPNHVPFAHGPKAIRAGNERQYEFRLKGGEVSPEVVRAVLARFGRSVATTVLPGDDPPTGALLFEIPVFHHHVSGGESGVLRVFENSVVFAADEGDHSRFWRYSDVRDIARLGRHGFEIATFEAKRWTDGKSYVFDLKREMTMREYEALWARVYQR